LTDAARIAQIHARIDADNPRINAVLERLPSSDNREGPLSNLIIGVKANIAVTSLSAHGGIKAYDGVIAEEDATAVVRLREAGATILGTLNMEEGALGAQTDNPWFGKTMNPLRDGFTPGGSSGGSAAAVASGFCDAALGTDTMGSVRIPSAYCGLFGFKPSHSKALLNGVMPLSPTLDTVGVHAKDLDMTVKVTAALLSQSLHDGRAGDIHVLDWQAHVACEPDIAKAFAAFTDRRSLPTTHLGGYAYGRSRRAGLILSEVEGYRIHAAKLEQTPEGFSPFFRKMMNYGRTLEAARIEAAYAHVETLRSEAAGQPEFIVMPTAPQVAFQFGAEVPANQADFTAYANLADRPAIQFPIGTNYEGLPIGAQLVGPRGEEANLVATLQKLLSA